MDCNVLAALPKPPWLFLGTWVARFSSLGILASFSCTSSWQINQEGESHCPHLSLAHPSLEREKGRALLSRGWGSKG